MKHFSGEDSVIKSSLLQVIILNEHFTLKVLTGSDTLTQQFYSFSCTLAESTATSQ